MKAQKVVPRELKSCLWVQEKAEGQTLWKAQLPPDPRQRKEEEPGI